MTDIINENNFISSQQDEVKKLQETVKLLERQNHILLTNRFSANTANNISNVDNKLNLDDGTNESKFKQNNFFLEQFDTGRSHFDVTDDVQYLNKDEINLSDIEYVNVDSVNSASEEQWLYQTSAISPVSYVYRISSDQWCRLVFEQPSADIETIRRSLLFKLEAFVRVPGTPHISGIRTIASTPASLYSSNIDTPVRITDDPFSQPTIKPSLLSLGSNTTTITRVKPVFNAKSNFESHDSIEIPRIQMTVGAGSSEFCNNLETLESENVNGVRKTILSPNTKRDPSGKSQINTNTFTRPKRRELSTGGSTPQTVKPQIDSSTVTRPRRLGSLSMPDVVSASGEGDEGDNLDGGDAGGRRELKLKLPKSSSNELNYRDGSVRKLSQDSLLDYELQKVDDVTDIEVMARMQEEDLRQHFATPRKSPQSRATQHRPSLTNIMNGTPLKITSRSASGPLLGSGVSSQSLGSAGSADSKFNSSPDSPYGSSQYMSTTKAPVQPNRGSSVPNLNHSLTLSTNASSQPAPPKPSSRLQAPQSALKQQQQTGISGLRQPAQSAGNLRQPSSGLRQLVPSSSNLGKTVQATQSTGSLQTALPGSGLRQPLHSSSSQLPAKSASTTQMIQPPSNMPPPNSIPRARPISTTKTPQSLAGGSRMTTEEADRDAGLVPSRAKSPGRSAIPAPRSSGLPRPSSSNKLTNSSENIASNGDVKRSSVAASTSRKLTVPRSYQDNWKDGCF